MVFREPIGRGFYIKFINLLDVLQSTTGLKKLRSFENKHEKQGFFLDMKRLSARSMLKQNKR